MFVFPIAFVEYSRNSTSWNHEFLDYSESYKMEMTENISQYIMISLKTYNGQDEACNSCQKIGTLTFSLVEQAIS